MNLLAIFPLNSKAARLLVTVCLFQAAIFGCYFVIERGLPRSFQRQGELCPDFDYDLSKFEKEYERSLEGNVTRKTILSIPIRNTSLNKTRTNNTELHAPNVTNKTEEIKQEGLSAIRLHTRSQGDQLRSSADEPLQKNTNVVSGRIAKERRRFIFDRDTGMNIIDITLRYRSPFMSQEQERRLAYILSLMKQKPVAELFGLQTVKLNWVPMDNPGTKEPHPWYLRADKMQYLMEHPIYKDYAIKAPEVKRKVDLLLIISTAPGRYERRQGIRETWWSECVSTARISVKCVFITDSKDWNTDEGKKLLEEQRRYGDLDFQNLKGGVEFGTRFLFHMVWAMQNYDFKYFLRMDDDYFLCLDRLMRELPIPARTNYHWGYVHCDGPDLVWPDESIVLFSRDIIEKFLGQDPYKMLCHPQADQMVAIWRRELDMTFQYNSDLRLHHDPPASGMRQLEHAQDICVNYMGLHGTYPKSMRQFWNHRGKDENPENRMYFQDLGSCPHEPRLRWELIEASEFAYIPKLCINHPEWDTMKAGRPGQMYIGREGKSSSGYVDEQSRNSYDKDDDEFDNESASASSSSSDITKSATTKNIKRRQAGERFGRIRSRIIDKYSRIIRRHHPTERRWKVLF